MARAFEPNTTKLLLLLLLFDGEPLLCENRLHGEDVGRKLSFVQQKLRRFHRHMLNSSSLGNY